MHRHPFIWIVASAILGGVMCGVQSCRKDTGRPPEVKTQTVIEHTNNVTYLDVTSKAGITWKHCNGEDGRVLFPEVHGGGAAFFDYDNDGWEDILLTQSRHWPGHRTLPESTMVLYHNNHDGTFKDVTKEAGLNVPMYSMGVTVGDYDNDGWDDIYITNFGGNNLFHNDHGVFHDVTAKAHVAGYGRWSTSAMWIDYDNDGYLDLFCLNYFRWSIETDVYCTEDGLHKSVCTPEAYTGDYNQLFHNNRDGTFSDATEHAGALNPPGKGLGVMMMDFDEDGWTDIVVANDVTPNLLLHNDHGRFTEIALDAGIAYGESGLARSGMGIDWADVDRDGKPTMIIGNFYGEMDWVYKYKGNGVFVDRAPMNGIGSVSLPYVTFAVMMFDYDFDGWPDMFCVNGGIRPETALKRQQRFHQESQLFRNLHNGSFEEVGLQYIGGPFAKRILGRGASYGDFNNDGNIDLLLANNNGYPILMQCVRTNGNHYLRVKLQGTKSNRNGFGAMMYAKVGAMKMVEMMKSGSSYQSSDESVVTFGLGSATQIDELVIKWNCGTVDTLRNVAGDRMIRVVEGSGAAGEFVIADR